MKQKFMSNLIAASFLVGGSGLATANTDIPTDFAELERTSALSETFLNNLMPNDIKDYTQLQLDELYARLPAGPIPEGYHRGEVIFSEESDIERILEVASFYGITESVLKTLGTTLWRGKQIDREAGIVKNRVGLGLGFPAKVYCGQSLIDARRESIIFDYAKGDELPGYNPLTDWIVTHKALDVRDELRMIRPGFYLGRAYLHGMFALNFTLFRDDPVAGKNICWDGQTPY